MSKKGLASTVFVISGIVFGIFLMPFISHIEETLKNVLMLIFSKQKVDWITSSLYASIIEAIVAIILLTPLALWCRKSINFISSEGIRAMEAWQILIRFSAVGFLFSLILITFAFFVLGLVTKLVLILVLRPG